MIYYTRKLTPEIEELLQKTIDETPACTETIETIKRDIETEQAMLFVLDDQAAFMCHFVPAECLYLNVSLLGGRENTMHQWKDELLDFIKSITKASNSKLLIITREGWKKIYPELKQIGAVYTL